MHTAPITVSTNSGHENGPSMAARAPPTPTDMAVMVKDHGRLARNHF